MTTLIEQAQEQYEQLVEIHEQREIDQVRARLINAAANERMAADLVDVLPAEVREYATVDFGPMTMKDLGLTTSMNVDIRVPHLIEFWATVTRPRLDADWQLDHYAGPQYQLLDDDVQGYEAEYDFYYAGPVDVGKCPAALNWGASDLDHALGLARWWYIEQNKLTVEAEEHNRIRVEAYDDALAAAVQKVEEENARQALDSIGETTNIDWLERAHHLEVQAVDDGIEVWKIALIAANIAQAQELRRIADVLERR